MKTPYLGNKNVFILTIILRARNKHLDSILAATRNAVESFKSFQRFSKSSFSNFLKIIESVTFRELEGFVQSLETIFAIVGITLTVPNYSFIKWEALKFFSILIFFIKKGVTGYEQTQLESRLMNSERASSDSIQL